MAKRISSSGASDCSSRCKKNWPFSLLEYWEQTREVDPGDYLVS